MMSTYKPLIKREQVVPTGHTDQIISLKILRNKYLITGSVDETVQIYNIFTNKKIRTYHSLTDPIIAVEAVKLRNSDLVLFSDFCNRIFAYFFHNSKLFKYIDIGHDVMHIYDFNDFENALFINEKGNLGIWNLLTNSIIFENSYEMKIVAAQKLCNQNNIFALGCYIEIVLIVQLNVNKNTVTHKILHKIKLLEEINEIYSILEYSIDERCLYVARNNFIIFIKFDEKFSPGKIQSYQLEEKNLNFKIKALLLIENFLIMSAAEKKCLLLYDLTSMKYQDIDSSINFIYFECAHKSLDLFKLDNTSYFVSISHEFEQPILIYSFNSS